MIYDKAMRQLLLNIRKTGVPFESAGLAAADAPYLHDIQRALDSNWIIAIKDDRYALTESGNAALDIMK